MSLKTVRIGIVGAGQNTQARHIPGFRMLDGVEIVSVCNRSRRSSNVVAAAFGIPTVYEDWRTLVAAPDTNAILIGTWPYLHHPVTLAALAAGKHVLCEARMAMNYREAVEMHRAAIARPDLVTQVVPSPLTLSVDRTIKRLIADHYLGEVLAIDIHALGNNFIDRSGPLHWRHNHLLSGFNIMSLGIWYEALMRWVGEAERVMALGKTFVEHRHDLDSGELASIEIPDHLTVIADMASGAQATISISNVAGLSGPDVATLYGDNGTLCYREKKLFGGQRGAPKLQEIAIADAEMGKWRVEEEFINAIRGLEPITHTSFKDSVRYMAFTEAVGHSLKLGTIIDIPDEKNML